MTLRIKTAPATTPVDLATVKKHLRIDYVDDDTLIPTYISGAASYMDGYTGILGLAMVSQVWELYCDAFPSDNLKVPLGPLISVDKIEYLSPSSGLYVDWPTAGNWSADVVSDPGWIIPTNSWPVSKDAVNAVRVTFTAGFGDDTKVPFALKAAMLLLIGDLYENRQNTILDRSVDQQSIAFQSLIRPFRRYVF